MDFSTIIKFLRLDNLVNHLTGFVETRVELLKLEVREEIVKIVSYGLMIAVSVLIVVLFLVLFSIGLANYISEQLGSTSTGYWFVSGTYALLFVIIILFRKNIERSIESHLKERANHRKGK